MESWDDGDRIKSSMDVILELEAIASASVQAMPGLPSLLAFLRASGVRVGLVTRNTTESLNAFFDGEAVRGWGRGRPAAAGRGQLEHSGTLRGPPRLGSSFLVRRRACCHAHPWQ